MTGRSTRSNTANNTNPPNETADEVTRQLNIALPNLLTQLVQALGGNQANQRDVAQSCTIKTFRASSAKEFFSTEGTVGLLSWFKSIESVLHVTKHPAESQFEFASSMLQGRALTWWNTLFQTRGWAATIAQPWDDFKKLLMEEYCPDVEVQKSGRNFALTAPEQGQGQRQYKETMLCSAQWIGQGQGQRPICMWSQAFPKCVQNATSIILVTAPCVVDVTKWVTLLDTARVELLMKDEEQLVLSVEILTTLGGIAQG
ncbi:putative reverse transcriptase domain-containing protein [Tanacetum coccineum]|uniref:Reverse transcriptase domain-containing protein n=1 Tax=Tanacetum coccineum TaxID=301880 RepID=A0ABQ5H7Q3_9ASTR